MIMQRTFVIVHTLQWRAIEYHWVNGPEYHRPDNPRRQISLEIPPPVTRSTQRFGDALLAELVHRRWPTSKPSRYVRWARTPYATVDDTVTPKGDTGRSMSPREDLPTH